MTSIGIWGDCCNVCVVYIRVIQIFHITCTTIPYNAYETIQTRSRSSLLDRGVARETRQEILLVALGIGITRVSVIPDSLKLHNRPRQLWQGWWCLNASNWEIERRWMNVVRSEGANERLGRLTRRGLTGLAAGSLSFRVSRLLGFWPPSSVPTRSTPASCRFRNSKIQDIRNFLCLHPRRVWVLYASM